MGGRRVPHAPRVELRRKGIELAKSLGQTTVAVLSANPLTVDPKSINTITVMETIKEGKSIYTRR